MLVLTRSTGEAILVDPDYRLEVLGCADGVATIELTDGGTRQRPDRRRLFKLRPEQGLSLPTPDQPDGRCEVLCCSVRKQKVRLGFTAGREVEILREEVAIERAAIEQADRAIGTGNLPAADREVVA